MVTASVGYPNLEMPVYLCRWPNGAVSVVQARNKTEAVVRLDEFDNAETSEITKLDELLLKLGLDDEGRLQLNQIGEGCENEIRGRAYPELEAARGSEELEELDDTSEEYRAKIREAVARETTRLMDRWRSLKVRPPKTELGKRIQEQTGAASALVDHWVEEITAEILEDTDDESIN